MSEMEVNNEVHKIVIQQFAFAKTLARALNNGRNNKELEKFIIKESIKELKFVLKNK